MEVEAEEPGCSNSCKAKMVLEQDLYLSSDTDPFQSDDEYMDPTFDPTECKKKGKKTINFMEHEHQEPNESSDTNEEDENVKKKSRKRQRLEHTWKKNKIKSSRNCGKEYISWKGKKQPARQIKEPCNNKCRIKCVQKINEEERNILFKEYWELGDVNRQRDFIARYVTVNPKVRSRVRRSKKIGITAEKDDAADSDSYDGNENSRRNLTFIYCLPKDGNKVQICKTFFLNTLSISAQVVKTVFKKTGTSGVVSEDRRGKVCKNTLIDESVKQTIRDHINLFATVESHYCRQNTSRKYLPATLNVSKMYALYLEYCQDNNIAKPVNEAIYRNIFNKDFNLSFFQPKKDLCDICHNYDNSSPEQKLSLEENYRIHIKNKNAAREIKQSEKQRANESKGKICCAVFDLQQVLQAPKINVGLSYYKLKLSVFNFTVFNLATKGCNCYMWTEVTANRGASEIGSCLRLYIIAQAENGIKEFSFFSDNCSGQNRNKFLYSLYNYLTHKYQITIKHTYLEKGHTQSEGDSVHSVIERAARNVPIYTPEQWYTVVRSAKRKDPYNVFEISKENIFDLKDLEKKTCINWEKDEENEKVFLSKIKIVETNPEFPNTLLFKVNYEDSAYKKLKLTEKGRKKIDVKIAEIKLKQCYEKEIPLKQKKYNHLQFLCQKGAILGPYHTYFQRLPFSSKNTASDSDNDE